jgi:hypothetical protein
MWTIDECNSRNTYESSTLMHCAQVVKSQQYISAWMKILRRTAEDVTNEIDSEHIAGSYSHADEASSYDDRAKGIRHRASTTSGDCNSLGD